MMKFSLILCTLNREQVVREFLGSLAVQIDAPPFEVIVVDQNPDDRLLPILHDYETLFPIRRFRSAPGLSRARNVGLDHVTGEIVAFPDDDCTYPPGILRAVSDAFDADPEMDGLSTLVTDSEGHRFGSFRTAVPQRITPRNVWRCGVSISIFIRTKSNCARFDETLGVGSGTPFGSGEETDFLLTLLQEERRLEFLPGLVVHHPCFNGPWKMRRGYLYGNGAGRVLRKHGYPVFHVFFAAGLQFVRSLQAFFTLNFPRVLFHLAMAWGRLCGYFRPL